MILFFVIFKHRVREIFCYFKITQKAKKIVFLTSFLCVSDETFTCYENIEEYSLMRVQAKFWLEGVGIAVSGTFGLLGNTMSVIVLNTYTSNRSFNNLLISLSIVDNLLIIFTLVEKAIIGSFLSYQPAWFINCYPLLWHPVKGMIHTAAIYMVVAVSAERFRAMCFPLRKRVAFYKFVGFVISN